MQRLRGPSDEDITKLPVDPGDAGLDPSADASAPAFYLPSA